MLTSYLCVGALAVVACGDTRAEPFAPAVDPSTVPPVPPTTRTVPTPIEVDASDGGKITLLLDVLPGFENVGLVVPSFHYPRAAMIRVDDPLEVLPYALAIRVPENPHWVENTKQDDGYVIAWFGPVPHQILDAADKPRVRNWQFYVLRTFGKHPVECRGEAATEEWVKRMVATCRALRLAPSKV